MRESRHSYKFQGDTTKPLGRTRPKYNVNMDPAEISNEDGS